MDNKQTIEQIIYYLEIYNECDKKLDQNKEDLIKNIQNAIINNSYFRKDVEPMLYKLLNYFLDDYSNELSNRGCNDLSPKLISLFSKKEKEFILKVIRSTQFKRGEDKPNKFENLQDLMLLSFINTRIKDIDL